MRDTSRGHVTVIEVLIVVLVIGLLWVIATPIFAVTARDSASAQSMANLMDLNRAMSCYAADWNDRQFGLARDDFGEYGDNCSAYLQNLCPPPSILGWDQNGALWGYYLGSQGACSAYGFPGNCANWGIYRPIDFNDAFGAFRVPNLRGLRIYLGCNQFYQERFYARKDTDAYEHARAFFGSGIEFAAESGGDIALSSYCFSPAAMYHPDVMRAPSEGGFQDPGALSHSYVSPTAGQAKYADLKTRMIEHNWLQNPPSIPSATRIAGANLPGSLPCNPFFSECEPYYFNHGMSSMPNALFFDGSVRAVSTAAAVIDDATILDQTGGVDGLWSRDTPLGASGYLGDASIDGTTTSYHVLTTGGIRGRDFLE